MVQALYVRLSDTVLFKAPRCYGEFNECGSCPVRPECKRLAPVEYRDSEDKGVDNMTNSDTVTLVEELYTVRRTKAGAEKREKELVALVGPAADTAIAALSLPDGAPQTCVFGRFKVLRVPGVNSRVDAQALLDHGIAPDVIADCTKRTPFQTYRVSPVKEQ